MSTLKELMGDKTKGDGRKFALDWWDRDRWFEPIFKDISGDWSGLRESGFLAYFPDSGYTEWEEWTPPKQTKKVKLYSPVYENLNNLGYYESHKRFTSNKQDFLETAHEKIVGWQEMEVEVD